MAGRQADAVARAQLIAAGLTSNQIAHAVATGRLHAERRGVYRMSATPLSYRGRQHAALLIAGEDGDLSHRAAAVVWGLLSDTGGPLHLTTPTQRRDRPGLRFHTATLDPRDRARRDGLRVTGLARTLLDTAASEPPDTRELIVQQACIVHKRLIRHAWEILERSPGHPGRGTLRAALARTTQDPGEGAFRSALEQRFWAELAPYRDRLPSYTRNQEVRVGTDVYLGDVVFASQRVIVELDSRAWHDNDPRFDSDRRRDQRLAAQGWIVVRITARHLRDEPEQVVADLLALLTARTLRRAS